MVKLAILILLACGCGFFQLGTSKPIQKEISRIKRRFNAFEARAIAEDRKLRNALIKLSDMIIDLNSTLFQSLESIDIVSPSPMKTMIAQEQDCGARIDKQEEKLNVLLNALTIQKPWIINQLEKFGIRVNGIELHSRNVEHAVKMANEETDALHELLNELNDNITALQSTFVDHEGSGDQAKAQSLKADIEAMRQVRNDIRQAKTDIVAIRQANANIAALRQANADIAAIRQAKADLVAIRQANADIAAIRQAKADIEAIRLAKADIAEIRQAKADIVAIRQAKADIAVIRQAKTDIDGIRQAKTDIATIRLAKAHIAEIRRAKADIVAIRQVKADVAAIRQTKADIDNIRQVKPDIDDIRQAQSDIAIIRQAKDDIAAIRQAKADIAAIRQAKTDIEAIRQAKTDIAAIKADIKAIRETKADIEDIRPTKAGKEAIGQTTVDLVTTTQDFREIVNNCERNWVQFGNFCYRDLGYRHFNAKNMDKCASYGGYVLDIQSYAEQIFIESFVQRNVEYHLGLVQQSDGTYKWQRTNRSPVYTNWAPGEPDTRRRGTCVIANLSLDSKWKVLYHSYVSRIICKKELKPLSGSNPNGKPVDDVNMVTPVTTTHDVTKVKTTTDYWDWAYKNYVYDY